MFRTVGDQPSLFESVLPAELLRLPEELARVDALLDDPAFFAPFVPFFDPRIGRPSTPMETYLRLMFLKFRYRLGYETLCREVSDSITWRRFCRIPLGGVGAASDHVDEADHPLRPGCGRRAERGAVGQGGRGEAVAHQPGPGGHDGGAVQRRLPDRLGSAGQGDQPDRGDAAADPGRRWGDAHQGAGPVPSRGEAGAFDRREAADPQRGGKDEAQAAVRRVTSELADLAETVAKDAERVLANAKQALRRARAKAKDRRANGEHDAAAGRRRGRLARAVNDLTELVGATRTDRRADPAAAGRDHTRRAPPAESACTTPTPGRSPRAGWASRSSSATRPSWPTTKTASFWTTPSSKATRPTRRSSRPRSNGSPAGPAATPRDRHRRPRLRRAEGRRRPPRAGCAHRGDPPQRQTGHRPDRPRNTDGRSDEPSSGEPASKAGSAPSNAATDGTEPGSTEPKEPGSGPATESWPTT